MTGPVSGNSTQVWFEGEARAYQAGVRDGLERARQLAIQWKASYWATTDTPGGGIDMEYPFADLLTDPEGTTT